MARATLHHSSAKTTSIFPLSCPLGCAGPKGGSLAAASSTQVPLCQANAVHIGTSQEPAWAPHSLGGYLAAPCGLWGGQQLSHPLSSCRSRGAASQTICCTDFVLLSLSGAAWSLPRRGPGMARSLYWILIVLLSGVGKKKSVFKSSCGCITLKGGC